MNFQQVLYQFGIIDLAIFCFCNRANLKSGAKVELQHRIHKCFPKILLRKIDNLLKISFFLAQKFCDAMIESKKEVLFLSK